MSSILFSHSYFMRFDPKQWKWMQPYAPLATIQAAAVMSEKGFEVRLHDVMFSSSAEEVKPVLKEFRPDYFVIYDDGFNYLTKMCLTNMRVAAWQMAKFAKEAGCTVIVSSSDSTDHYLDYLNNNADFVMLGEAEQTLEELIAHIEKGEKHFQSIAGIAFIENGIAVKTQSRPLLKNLDTLPIPAWDLVDMNDYKSRWLNKWGHFSINIATTRGCPYKCNWCAKPIYGNAYNMRSPAHVVAEIKILQQKFQFTHIWFCDDIFGLKRNWVIEYAELIQQQKLHFKYKIQSRADLLVQEKYVEALAASGCETVWMGAESGSQKILDAMDKGITIDQIRQATSLLKSHNIKPAFFLQFGYPGETVEDIEKTVALLNECLPEDIGVSVSYPLPGTKFYETVKNQLKQKSNWTDSDELALMFSNTYPPSFYKQLHRYVHKNYRKHQGFDSVKNIFSTSHKLDFKAFRRIALLPYFIPASAFEKLKLNAIW